MMRIVGLLFVCLAISQGPAPTSAPAGAVSIDKGDPVVDRVMFNRNHPPADMPKLKPGEAALARSNYECRAGVRYEVLSSKQVGDHWHVVARIRHVDVETRLTDTIFLPMLAPVLLRAHEEGHREMNERIYQQGQAIAQAAGAEIMAHDWECDGVDAKAAGKAATDLAVHHLCDVYLEGTANRASRAGDIYDRLTDHGRNQLYVANAIRLSFIEEKQPTTQTGELLRPTTREAK
jgi:hypothetical protein